MSEIRITIPAETQALIERARTMPDRLLKAIARGMTLGTAEIHGKISAERLTGQGPFPVGEHKLGVVTNRLRGSLRWTQAQVSGSKATSSIGTNVAYAGANEFGFAGSVQVKAHTRRVASVDGSKTTLAAAAKASKIRRKVKPSVSIGTGQVKAHTRQMNIPERAPIRTGIGEHSALLTDAIGAAIREDLAP